MSDQPQPEHDNISENAEMEEDAADEARAEASHQEPSQESEPTPVSPPAGEEPAENAPALAEPGVYYCDHENAGEHPVLGRLEQGKEYDYSQVTDQPTLMAIAACVESGLLRKV